MDTLELPTTPPLAGSLARALLTARGRHGGRMPAVRHRVRDVAVDPARLAAYRRLLGFPVTGALPVTYPHLLAFPVQVALMTRPDFPYALPGLVHVGNAITAHRAIDAAERLDVEVWADGAAWHRSGTTVDLHAVVTVAGEPVWESRSTYLARGIEGPDGPPAPDPAAGVVPPERPVAVWRLPADAGRRYAAVSGDVNPIHLGALPARAFGFPRAIAHGMGTVARVLAAFEGRLPDAVAVDVAFRKPILLPGTVTLASEPAHGGWDVAVRGRRGDALHLVGSLRPV